MSDFEQKFNEEIEFRDLRYGELKNEKTIQEKQHFNLFRNMENNQYKAVQELELLYEKKLDFEKEKYIQLEQILIEEKQKFQRNLKELEQDSSKQIAEIRQKFQQDLKQLYDATGNRDVKQLLVSQQEQIIESELYDEYIESIKNKYNEKINEYQNQIKFKDKQISIFQSEKLNFNHYDQVKQELKLEKKAKYELEKQINELISQNSVLQEQIQQNEYELSRQNDQIKELQKYINGLQKTKLVLSYKTYEMQGEIEPKDKRIKDLLESIPKLEEEIHIIQTEKRTQDEKEKRMLNQIKANNEEVEKLKQQFKKYQELYRQITTDIYNCYHEKKEKDWIEFLKDLYAKYITKHKNLKQSRNSFSEKNENQTASFTRDVLEIFNEYRESEWPQQLKILFKKYFIGEVTNELVRNTQHLEQSKLATQREKQQEIYKRDKQIEIKTNENSALLIHLNKVLKEKKLLEKAFADKNSKFESLLKAYQRLESQSENKRSNLFVDDSVMNRSVVVEPPQNQKKGKLIRGLNYTKQNQQRFEQQRNSDLLTEVEFIKSRNQSLEQQMKFMKQRLAEAGIDEEQTQTNTQRPFSQSVGRRY